MKPLSIASWIGIALTVLPGLLFWMGSLGHDAVKMLALAGTAVWFATTPFWLGRELKPDANQVEI